MLIIIKFIFGEQVSTLAVYTSMAMSTDRN